MRLFSDNTDRTIYYTNIRNTWTKQGTECCGKIMKSDLMQIILIGSTRIDKTVRNYSLLRIGFTQLVSD
jgi:hypothetical protein